MKHRNSVVCILQCLILIASLNAHGVQHHIWTGGVGVEVHHEVMVDGETEIPLAYADVQVFSPADAEHPFQTGKTDIHGVFMFRPDTLGIWQLKFLDESGHGKVVEVPVAELNAVEMEAQEAHPRWLQVISGTGFLLFAFGLWYLFKKKS